MAEGERGAAFHLAREFKRTHTNVIEAVQGLDEQQMRWRPPRSNSIAFNVWHIARWADHLGSILSTMTPALRERIGPRPEIWSQQDIARRWGFPREGTGHVETGMGMDEDLSTSLPLPPSDALLEYAREAFRSADGAIARVSDDDLAETAEIEPTRVPWLSGPEAYGTVATWLVVGLRHESRHLGMIEAIKGALGMRGTATV